MHHDFIGDLVHLKDLFPLNIHGTGQAEIAPQGAGQIVVLDSLGRIENRIHENEKMISPSMPLLMIEKKIHKRLIELKHLTSL